MVLPWPTKWEFCSSTSIKELFCLFPVPHLLPRKSWVEPYLIWEIDTSPELWRPGPWLTIFSASMLDRWYSPLFLLPCNKTWIRAHAVYRHGWRTFSILALCQVRYDVYLSTGTGRSTDAPWREQVQCLLPQFLLASRALKIQCCSSNPISMKIVLPAIKMIVQAPLYFSTASKLERRGGCNSLTEGKNPACYFILHQSWF